MERSRSRRGIILAGTSSAVRYDQVWCFTLGAAFEDSCCNKHFHLTIPLSHPVLAHGLRQMGLRVKPTLYKNVAKTYQQQYT